VTTAAGAILRPVLLPHDDAGAGPALILLHAGVADRRMWSGHLAPLAASGHRVIAPDLPGFGDATLPPGGEAAPWNDVLETMDALGVERAALVGNSLGAAIALAAAVLAPERVTNLVLVSTPLDADPAAIADIRAPALFAAGERDSPDFRAAAEALAREAPEGWHAVIAGAGHLAPLEQPAAFRELTLRFIDDVSRAH